MSEDEGCAEGTGGLLVPVLGQWVIAAGGALPVAWEHARSPVPTQPCMSQDGILNRLLWAPLPPAPLLTASGLCFLWPGLGGPHTSQGSYRLSELTPPYISGGDGSCSSQQLIGARGEVLPGITPTLVLAQA